MLLRILVENVLSFKNSTEFNTFPSPLKNKRHHKQRVKNLECLKVAAIYGANGAGKSNLVMAIEYLKDLIKSDDVDYYLEPFRLNESFYYKKPSKIEIEFFFKNSVYYYEIAIKDGVVVKEILWKNSHTNNPEKIFERAQANKRKTITIEVDEKYLNSERDKIRISILEEEVVKSYQPAIGNPILRKAVKDVELAYTWITKYLVVVTPISRYKGLVYNAFNNKAFFNYLNKTLSVLDTGIDEINFKESALENFFGEDEKNKIEDVKKELDGMPDAFINIDTNIGEVVAQKKANRYIVNQLKFIHNCHEKISDEKNSFDIIDESEGTQRLFDLIPMTYALLNNEQTYIVDEIERSIHPVLIKELLTKILDGRFKGQLIFTTHESSLLDLDLFRQDEIWLTEKNPEGATTMYPLSEFKPRVDLDIRKGYLNGRFGAIPFLGSLKELNWEKLYEEK